MVTIPDHMVNNNQQARGPEGLSWLRRLPELISDLQRHWSIAVADPYPRLSYNYAAPALRADGTRAVLKLSFPNREFESEAHALQTYAGHGMAQLLECDLELGALLMEQLEPGTPLHTLQDEQAEITIAADIMRQLWRCTPDGYPFPTVAEWGEAFARHRAEYGGHGPLPAAIFERGELLYRELDAAATERVLLHGDLHHDNILAARRRPWLAIDPKGIVGDPAFEVGPLLYNLWEDLYPAPDPGRVLVRRVDLLAEALGFDRARVRDWGIACCVLSAVWSAEDGGTGWESAIAAAEILAALEF